MASKRKFTARNNLRTKELFKQRRNFANYAYGETEDTFNPYPLDIKNFWQNEVALFGKVSDSYVKLMEPVEPYVPYLLSMPTQRELVYALNFVVDAFQKFKLDYLLEITRGNLISDDPYLSQVEPVKGYTFLDKQYNNMQQSFYKVFLKYMERHNIKTNIQTLEDFVNEMLYFLETGGKVSYTRTSFIMSRFSSPLVTGLAIEISDLPYSEDEEKKKFIDSPNFKSYTKIAIRNGFVVDKNIPWRLVADIQSEPILELARQYQPNVREYTDILNSFFIQSSFLEIQTFKTYVLKLYNQFVLDNPINIRTTHTGVSTNKIREARKKSTLADFEEQYGDDFCVKFYMKLKNKETGLNYSEPAIKAMTEVALEILMTSGLTTAMSYVKRKFSGFEFHEGSLNFDYHRILQANGSIDSGGHGTKELITSKARKTRKIFY